MESSSVTPQQCRMARAALGLGVRDLAALVNVSPNTIARFERGEPALPQTVADVQGALERAGVRFLAPGTSEPAEGPGVVALPSARGSGTGAVGGPFRLYKAQATAFGRVRNNEGEEWCRIWDWYKGGGRDLFIEAFTGETGIKLNVKTDGGARLGAALPKSMGDYGKKFADRAFYRANAEWFLSEMDHIVASVPRKSSEPDATFAYGNVLRFVHHVLLDSVMLLAHWGAHCAKVPRDYGIGKNEMTHLVQLFHGTRQIIYGHGSFGLSVVENHSDIAVGTIRQAVELRLRRAFGLLGKEVDGTFHPVPLLDLLSAIDPVAGQIRTPIPFPNIKRVNAWANLFLHYGIKSYAWAPPRVLDYMRPFLVGGDKAGGSWTVDSGVVSTRSAFDAVRNSLIAKVEGFNSDVPGQVSGKAIILLLEPDACDIVFEKPS
jgi:transcriptional regulator with XRE-family HTH domain